MDLLLEKNDNKLLHILEGHKGLVYNIQFSPDSSKLASCSDDKTIKFINAIRSEYAPHKVLLLKDTSLNDNQLEQLANWTSTQYSIDEMPTAYICKNFACNQPTNDLKTALTLLNE